ncbi:MAG: sarcosine oxidase subunit alpha family protein [Filomicrobium sp.]|nr:sarcosine oxidase subunit alpha family protein [Filomicrobium sp.]
MSERDASKEASQSFRVPGMGSIDTTRTITFTFDGRIYEGHPGDTLASALLANGVRLVGRSFKYHRPRGILSAGSEEPNALVELRTGNRREPNTKATTVELYDGLEASSQNRWPSLAFDVLSINQLAGSVLSAGFYYKTFMWPAAFWEKLYEPVIRRAAGLGRAASEADPDSYDKVTAHCDVLVIGGGPAGLAAALSAASAGARVIIADENPELGGRCLAEKRTIDEMPSAVWAKHAQEKLRSTNEVRVLTRTTVFGVYDGRTYGALERVSDHLPVPPQHQPRQRLWRIIAKRVVLASGATERPMVFGENDRPGVMLAGAVRTYINRFGVVPGRRAAVFANNDDAITTIADIQRAGAEVVAYVDSRKELSPAVLAVLSEAGVDAILGGHVETTTGTRHITGATVRTADGEIRNLPCDLIAMSGGWNPNLQLATHLNARPHWNETIAAFVPSALPPGMAVAGAANGLLTLAEALASGAQLGIEAAHEAGRPAVEARSYSTTPEASSIAPLWRVPETKGKAFVDFQHDVTTDDVVLAHREGFAAVEHLKRYTTLGMGTDQGKTSNVNALAIMAALTESTIPAVGTTTARPPYTPVAIGALGGAHRGRDFKPERLPPSYQWAREQGAVFTQAGLWLRPQYFPRPGERDWQETVFREVDTTRNAVGICDVSTLGKIDVQGRDAIKFLESVYINNWGSLAVGRARYGVMLREDGMVLDDGTTARLGEHHFLMTTTTGNAAKVLQHLEFCRQCLWPDLDVQLAPVTDQWAQFSMAGPKSRDLLRKIVDSEFDISDAAFPYMAAVEVAICGGLKARLFRLSFSGERAYEIAVPSRYGDALIRRLMTATEEFDGTAYGTEAMGVMRIEKGHLGAAEMNGTTTAYDLGLGRMMSDRKDFIGRTLGSRSGLMDPDRPRLVGLRPINPKHKISAGAHLLPQKAHRTAANDEGHVTSAAFSPILGHTIALGLLKRGPERVGEIVGVCDPLRGRDILAKVVSPEFFDPSGEKLRG